MTEPAQSFYDAVGGDATFRTIVSRFYELVRDDEILRPLYPEDDLDGAEERLRMFLEQYWGGPRTYSDQRGHPRLRMRHSPFQIGYLERDAWLRCMHTAVAEIDSQTLDDAHRTTAVRLLGDGGAVDGQLVVLSSSWSSGMMGGRDQFRRNGVVVRRRLLPGVPAILPRQRRLTASATSTG